MPSFSNTLEQAIHGALALANARRHELATLEHLLLALIDEPDAAKVMRACSVNLEALKKTLVDFIDDDLSTLRAFYADKRGKVPEKESELVFRVDDRR